MGPTLSEETESIFSLLGIIRRFHPIAVLMIVSLLVLSVQIWSLDVALEKKLVPVALSVFLYFFTGFFEFYRIGKEKEDKEKIWRMKLFNE